jgi:hypothetical protein
MIIFTLSDGKRVGIAAFDIHRVYSTPDPNSCNVTYHAWENSDWGENTTAVVGTFDAIIAAVEESTK